MAPLHLSLAIPSDDEVCKRIAAALEKLIEGTVDPATTAQIIDKIVVDDCQEAYLSYTSLPDPTAVTQIQLEDGTVRTPQPTDLTHYVWNLPVHNVPWLARSDLLTERRLWDLSPENNYDRLEYWLQFQFDGNFRGNHLIENPEAVPAWLYFSACLARMMAAGVFKSSHLSPMAASVFGEKNITFTAKQADAIEQARLYEPNARAAAEWMFYAGDILYECCQKNWAWTMGSWGRWKIRFEEVNNDERFGDETRKVVGKALEILHQIERDGSKRGTEVVLRKLGWAPPVPVNDEEEDEEEVADDDKETHEGEASDETRSNGGL